MPGIAEGFGTTGASSRERSSPVAAGEARGHVGPTNILVQESGVKAIAGSHRVHWYDFP